MNPSYPNLSLNLEDYPYTQYYQNSPFLPNASQVPVVTENLQTSKNSENQSRGGSKWDVDEDIALMSAWSIISENSIVGKNQKKQNFWAQVKKLYDAAQVENPEKLSTRNEAQMRGRFKRLNENCQKWVSAYQEAYRQRRSGMVQKDIESVAHKIYEQDRNSKFTDYVVFNEVMCKLPKWDLQINHDTRRGRSEEGNEESGGSSKRTRTTEEGEYCVNPNPETPTSGGSITQRPIGRDAAKRKAKGKGKGIGNVSNEFVEELRALTVTRKDEIEFMKERLEFDKQREQTTLLNTLLQKQFLTPEEENLKRHLMLKFFGSV